MIDALFPGVRRDVLALLLTRPDEWFYQREILRATGGGKGALARELKALSEAGILLREQRGNRVYYRANPDCPIYDELRGMMVKSAGLGDLLREALAGVTGVRLAFIYGSAARGTLDARSDVDVLLVTDGPLPDISAALLPARARVGREIASIVYSSEEFADKRKAGDAFLEWVLAEPKIMLVGKLDDTA